MAGKGQDISDRTYVHDFDGGITVEVDCKRADGRISLEAVDEDSNPRPLKSGYIQIVRKRNSTSRKSKVIAAGPAKDTTITIDPDAFFFNYDHMLIVDTNTRTEQPSGDVVSVTAVIGAYIDPAFKGSGTEFRLLFRLWNVMEIRNSVFDPERLGWALALEALQESNLYVPDKRFALVVDSHLGCHKELVERKEPVVDWMELPPNVDLVYVSADTGKESGLNALMSWCDRAANYVQRHIAQQEAAHPLHPAPQGRGFESSRTWEVHTG